MIAAVLNGIWQRARARQRGMERDSGPSRRRALRHPNPGYSRRQRVEYRLAGTLDHIRPRAVAMKQMTRPERS